MNYYGLNRYICSVLDDMRKAYETRNFAYMPSLIEEAQCMADRMEAALADLKDIREAHEELKNLKKEIKALKAEKKEIKGE